MLRPDHLGDVVLFSGAFRHLRAHYSGSEITVCSSPVGVEYLQRSPHIDRLAVWPPSTRRSPGVQWSVVLFPLVSPASEHHDVVRGLDASEKYGIGGDLCNQTYESDHLAEEAYTSRLHVEDRQRQHEMVATRNFLRHIGIGVRTSDLWPQLWTARKDRRWAELHVPQNSDRTTIAISPGVTMPKGKIYPPEQYPPALAGSTDRPIDAIIFGAEEDRSVCTDVSNALNGHRDIASITNLAGKTTIAQLVEGLRRASVVLAADAAPLHLATALRRPTVGIMGGGHFGRCYPWGDPKIHRVANRPMDCYWCNWACRYETVRCVEGIEPATITRELRAALAAADSPVKVRNPQRRTDDSVEAEDS